MAVGNAIAIIASIAGIAIRYLACVEFIGVLRGNKCRSE